MLLCKLLAFVLDSRTWLNSWKPRPINFTLPCGQLTYKHCLTLLTLLQIRIYDLGQSQGYKCLHKINIASEIEKWSNSSLEDSTEATGRFHGLKSHAWSCDYSHVTWNCAYIQYTHRSCCHHQQSSVEAALIGNHRLLLTDNISTSTSL